jgi:hypothetical protein
MMRRGPRLTICACCAAVAMVASGAGVAAAAPTAPRTAAASQAAPASTQWSVNGSNSVDVGYDGQDLVYSVTFTQTGTSLSGTLDDPYYPTSGPISGSISGTSITFTFSYPSGSIQGTRTYTGTIDSSGAVSGTWTQTGSESPDNGTWSLAGNAVAQTSSPTQACTTATAAYQAANRTYNNLLDQLRNAQDLQTEEQNRVSELTQEVNADDALIKQVRALLSEGRDDNNEVLQDLAGLTSTIKRVSELPRSAIIEGTIDDIRTTLFGMNFETGEVSEALAATFFQRAAAIESAEAAQAASVIDLISTNFLGALGIPGLTAVAVEAGKIGTAEGALEIVLLQLTPLQDQYNQATANIGQLKTDLEVARDVLDEDNADVADLTNQVNAAQTADQAALNAMTNACRAG